MFSDQTVLVTGAAGGLGSEVCLFFKRLNASVIAVDLSLDLLGKTFGSDQLGLSHYAADLTKKEESRDVLEEIMSSHPRIDVLCNIAGGFFMGETVHQTSESNWNFLFDLNVRSIVNTASVLVPKMIDRGGGKIINIGARAALGGMANMGAYTASKSAVIRITEAMSEELRDQNINVNCILPGVIDTPKNRSDMAGSDFSKWVSPSEIAEVIGFLASEKSVAINGASIPVYGRS